MAHKCGLVVPFVSLVELTRSSGCSEPTSNCQRCFLVSGFHTLPMFRPGIRWGAIWHKLLVTIHTERLVTVKVVKSRNETNKSVQMLQATKTNTLHGVSFCRSKTETHGACLGIWRVSRPLYRGSLPHGRSDRVFGLWFCFGLRFPSKGTLIEGKPKGGRQLFGVFRVGGVPGFSDFENGSNPPRKFVNHHLLCLDANCCNVSFVHQQYSWQWCHVFWQRGRTF